jgi:hypothetical protein
MVSVAVPLVSSTMLDTSVPLRKVLIPRLRSAWGPVIVAPRSGVADVDDGRVVAVDGDGRRGRGGGSFLRHGSWKGGRAGGAWLSARGGLVGDDA